MVIDTFHFVKAGKIHFFCPLCQYHQITNSLEKVSWRQHLRLALLTLTVTWLGWSIFGLKGAAFYFVFWGSFEFVYRARKRHALICQSCGFDPFLYKQDVTKARQALRKHWEARIGTENLFAGKKLRNYQTKPLNQVVTEVQEKPKETGAPARAP